MDRRVYILPIISVLIVLILILRPDITGFMVAEPLSVPAGISVSINEDGFIPEDSIVTVYLGSQNSSMDFKEFVRRTGRGYERIRAEIPKIGYDGYGYAGIYTYVLDISEFDIDTILEPGEHNLTVEVSYGNYVISHTSQKI
ncbi:MAG: hypothetical protein KAT94_02565, partial [Candidatus Aenigmarchaeota archaeon]|nr:hypothetical protein [Candidatus Aenigmarchaeota archaeon]